MTRLDEPLRRVLGDRTARVLANGLGLQTVEDLLRHYPRRYAERGRLTDLAMLQPDEHATVLAEVASVSSRRMRQRKGSILEVEVTDGTGRLVLTFFNSAWRERELVVGRTGLFSGKVGEYRGKQQLLHPDYLLLDRRDDDQLDDDIDASLTAVEAYAGVLIPVYPATAQLPSWRVAKAIATVLDTADVADPLPDELRERRGLVPLVQAFLDVHRPAGWDDVHRGQRRLVFEEAFVLQAELARRRAAARALPAVPRPQRAGGVLDAFDARLPFRLTAGQQEVGAAVAADLAGSHPMQRLLQGEVGSGKTVVALRAMLTVVDAGGQAALLAPTEVLAQQHARSVRDLLGPLAEAGLLGGAEQGTRVALLTGSLGSAARRRALLDAASGEAGIVIGTHALLEERVAFADLGLVVVDEQHRFGVEQRAALQAKGESPPHVLVMTATPIPRTIAMTVFGDLDVSTLTELPAGRTPITTFVVPEERPRHVQRVWERVREEVQHGRQAYVVCPRIGPGEDPDGSAPADDEDADQDADELELPADPDDPDAYGGVTPRPRAGRAVLDVAPMLTQGPLAGLRLEVLHGRMPPEAKDDVMRRFAAGTVDVLVATTVVEVGVDVPNATAMVVVDAERFGVSQLHQLRGRVGRGAGAGLCLLTTSAPEGSAAWDRLDAVASTTDGFALSRVDLATRREGDVLGASQSGRRSSLRLLSVLRDEGVIADAREEAVAVVAADPELADHPALLAAIETWTGDERGDYLEKG